MINNILVLIAGASGAGKSTVINNLLKRSNKNFSRISTYTTRKPRQGEVPNEQYKFISEEEFLELQRMSTIISLLKCGKLLLWLSQNRHGR